MASSKLAAFAGKMTESYGERATTGARSYDVVSTGSLALDHAMRIGGWAGGRISEIMGPPDVGKTLICICSMREHQKAHKGKAVGYVDLEKTFDYSWAAKNGLDCSPKAETAGLWQHLRPRDSEDASDMARKCVGSGLFSIVVVDSIGGMESRKALEDKKGDMKEAADDVVAANAKVITRMVKHLASLAWETGTTVLLINQPRAVISAYGGADVSAGPKAMQHQTTVKVQMSRPHAEPFMMVFEEAREEVSVKVAAKVTRSKIFAKGGVAEFWINNRDTEARGPAGIDRLQEYVGLGISLGAIRQSGSFYQVPGAPQVQGRPAVVEQLRAQPELYAKIREAIFAGKDTDG